MPLSSLPPPLLEVVKLAFLLTSSYPLAWILTRFILVGHSPSSPSSPTTTNKTTNKTAYAHAFSIIASSLAFGLCFGFVGVAHLILSSWIVYFLLSILPLKDVRTPWIVFVVALFHLVANHTWRQFHSFGDRSFDHTAPQMVLVMKLSSLAWQLYDDLNNPPTPLLQEQQQQQQPAKLTRLPSFLEFNGFCFFIGGFLAGPAIDYKSYIHFINTHDPNSTKTRHHHTHAHRKWRKRNLVWRIVFAVVFVALHTWSSDKFTYKLALTQEFASLPLWRKWIFFCLSGFLGRSKYYAAWLLSEGVFVFLDIPSMRQVHIPNIELATNFRGVIANWNMRTAWWLKYTIYMRMPTYSSGLKVLATFTTSALWHGLYPGYFLTFISGALSTTSAKILRKTLRPLVVQSPILFIHRLYDVLGFILTQTVLNYIVGPFMLLSYTESIQFWFASGFFPIIHGGMLTMIALDYLGAWKMVRKLVGIREAVPERVVVVAGAGEKARVKKED